MRLHINQSSCQTALKLQTPSSSYLWAAEAATAPPGRCGCGTEKSPGIFSASGPSSSTSWWSRPPSQRRRLTTFFFLPRSQSNWQLFKMDRLSIRRGEKQTNRKNHNLETTESLSGLEWVQRTRYEEICFPACWKAFLTNYFDTPTGLRHRSVTNGSSKQWHQELLSFAPLFILFRSSGPKWTRQKRSTCCGDRQTLLKVASSSNCRCSNNPS